MAGQAAVRHTAGTWRARWEFWDFWDFWEVVCDCTAVGLTDALTREMSVVHESGRSISSADFCLTAVQSAVLFLKLPTILNPLKLLTSFCLPYYGVIALVPASPKRMGILCRKKITELLIPFSSNKKARHMTGFWEICYKKQITTNGWK